MLLEQAGVEVVLFEAKGRAGGRLHTVDEGDGVLYEAGGEWIDADHHRILNLMREFGMEPESRPIWPGKVVYHGRETTEDELWADAMEDDLRVEAAARELIRDLDTPIWKNGHKSELDNSTFEGFIANHCQSERGRWWVTSRYRSDEGDDPARIGLLGWLDGFRHYLDRDGDVMSAYRMPGGFSSFCERMLRSLGVEAQFSRVLRRVTQDESGVKLTFEDGEERVDRVILTLPPPALERVVFEPALTVHKRCAVEACRMSRAVKLVWQFSEPWWRQQGWGGSMMCDRAIQQTWDGSLGDAHILTAYICGDKAVEMMSLGDPVRAGVYELAQIFPHALDTFERGWAHNWLVDPYAHGAFSHLAPGYVLEHMEHIAPPQGRIHFAGEHTATWIGFIEGALESAERVSAEVLATEA
jgi:monoamine oxidase